MVDVFCHPIHRNHEKVDNTIHRTFNWLHSHSDASTRDNVIGVR